VMYQLKISFSLFFFFLPLANQCIYTLSTFSSVYIRIIKSSIKLDKVLIINLEVMLEWWFNLEFFFAKLEGLVIILKKITELLLLELNRVEK